jgi:hypothetical protein
LVTFFWRDRRKLLARRGEIPASASAHTQPRSEDSFLPRPRSASP